MLTSSTYTNDFVLGYYCIYCNNPMLLYAKVQIMFSEGSAYAMKSTVEETDINEAINRVTVDIRNVTSQKISLYGYVTGIEREINGYKTITRVENIGCPCPYCNGKASWQTNDVFADMSLYKTRNFPTILSVQNAISWIKKAHDEQSSEILLWQKNDSQRQERQKWYTDLAESKRIEYAKTEKRKKAIEQCITDLQIQISEANLINRNRLVKQLFGNEAELSAVRQIITSLNNQQKAFEKFDHFLRCVDNGYSGDLVALKTVTNTHGSVIGGALSVSFAAVGEIPSKSTIDDCLMELFGLSYLKKIEDHKKTMEKENNTGNTSMDTVVERKLKYCNKCGNEIPADSRFCNKCGAEINRLQVRYCNKCGSELVPNSLFCNKCGNKIIMENKHIFH